VDHHDYYLPCVCSKLRAFVSAIRPNPAAILRLHHLRREFVSACLARDVVGAIPLLEKTVSENKHATGARLLFYIYEHGVGSDGVIRKSREVTPDEKVMLPPSPSLSRHWLKQAASLGDEDSQWAYSIRCLQAARRAEGIEIAGRRTAGAPSPIRARDLRHEAMDMLTTTIVHGVHQRAGRPIDEPPEALATAVVYQVPDLRPAVWLWAQLGVRGFNTFGHPTRDASEDLLAALSTTGYQPSANMLTWLPDVNDTNTHATPSS
jgi:hypothetical protein